MTTPTDAGWTKAGKLIRFRGRDRPGDFAVEVAGQALIHGRQLAAFTLPRFVEAVQEFPRSAAKRAVKRRKLRTARIDGARDVHVVLGLRSAKGR